jgi:periplasmic glucans biosynthesis protein
LFLRKEIKKLAINPLTSMFFYGENTNIRPVDDFRPEIHDSDGLQILTETDEWIWRPLINPKRLLVTSFELNNPKGMGLFQRDQDFDNYQDLEAFYQLRPSLWTVPGKGWGKGRVELVQIPTDSEINDNIVCYWIPENIPPLNTPFSFSYQLQWFSEEKSSAPIARVLATRTANDKKEGKIYLVDFEGGKLNFFAENTKLEADISVGGGEIIEQYIQRIGKTNAWRLVFRIKKNESPLDNVLKKGEPLELRAFLRQGNEVLTETWSYVDP